jgi:hypothetical protein
MGRHRKLENAAIVGSVRRGVEGAGSRPFLCATSLSTAAFLWRHIAPAPRQQRAEFVNKL